MTLRVLRRFMVVVALFAVCGIGVLRYAQTVQAAATSAVPSALANNPQVTPPQTTLKADVVTLDGPGGVTATMQTETNADGDRCVALLGQFGVAITCQFAAPVANTNQIGTTH